MRKQIALFGGSFDPITDAHLKVAAEIIHAQKADEVWVTPCGPRKDKKLVASPLQRFIMCNLAIDSTFGSHFPVQVYDVEIQENKAIPTYFLLQRLAKEFLNLEFLMVIGADLLSEIRNSWHEGERLWQEARFLVIPRPGFKKLDLPKNFTWLEASNLQLAHTQLSSSEIRKRLARDFSLVEGLVPPIVLAHIIRYNLYKQVNSKML
ncbi:MAG: nicotinate-nicotinamide nucleotide adenylyltransferase [Candidatus Cloacimonetes bacterium]|nr:nicotinate-nicotinamide nucleotide adenylyltransferase [Candidatus Cloacimonadota bacterium]